MLAASSSAAEYKHPERQNESKFEGTQKEYFASILALQMLIGIANTSAFNGLYYVTQKPGQYFDGWSYPFHKEVDRILTYIWDQTELNEVKGVLEKDLEQVIKQDTFWVYIIECRTFETNVAAYYACKKLNNNGKSALRGAWGKVLENLDTYFDCLYNRALKILNQRPFLLKKGLDKGVLIEENILRAALDWSISPVALKKGWLFRRVVKHPTENIFATRLWPLIKNHYDGLKHFMQL